MPEHIQDVCIAYEEALRESGFEGRLGPYLTKLIKVGARDWYREYGVDPARMKWAMRYARSQQPPLIVKSPKSLIVIGQEYQPHKQDDRKRYTGGKYGQYVES